MSAVRAPSSELALIHGGPGARGSLRDLAEALPLRCLVLEQGRLTIEGLLEEMDAAIEAPMTLLGHSWGAWLATLYAARRPARVRKLILVGSGSFSPDPIYAEALRARREARIDEARRRELEALEAALSGPGDKDPVMRRFGALYAELDSHDAVHPEGETPSYEAYAAIWPEAAALRANGALLEAIRAVSAAGIPIHVIQGEADPHTPRGVIEPFEREGVAFTYDVLPRCGHYPWRERHARGTFLEVIAAALAC